MMIRRGQFWRQVWPALAVLGALVLVELAMHRPPICPCGAVRLWHGTVQSPENSQQIADWYSFSHIIHGFLFFWAGYWLLPRLSVGARLTIAAAIEAVWEIAENSPVMIDRYREATISWGYSGDSILNSAMDLVFMMLGFALARRLGWQWTLALAIAFEVLTAITIRDGLLLNIVMLVHPLDAIRAWQAAG